MTDEQLQRRINRDFHPADLADKAVGVFALALSAALFWACVVAT